MPVIVDLVARREMLQLRDIYQTSGRWLFYLILPATLSLILLAKPMLLMLFGQDYIGATTALQVLALGYLVNISTGSWGQVLIADGRTRLNMLLMIVYVLVNIPLDVLLISRFGMVGAAWGASMSMVIVALAGLLMVFWLYRIQPFSREHVRFGSLAVILYGGIWYLFSLYEAVPVFIQFLVIGVCYVICVLTIPVISAKPVDAQILVIVRNRSVRFLHRGS